MIEQQIAQNMFSQNSEKSYIDKLLGKSDIDSLRKVMKKDSLDREDINEILYLMSGAESKLWNFSGWERYIVLKLYTWIRDFVKNFEILFDYEQENPKLSANSKRLLENNKKYMSHNLKFLIDLYMNISRTTLSIGGTGFLEPLHNKFEISYPEQALAYNHKERRTLFGGKKE